MRWRAPFLLLGFCSSSLAFASALALPDVLTQLENKEKSIASIQFQFEQDILFTQTGQSTHVLADALFAKSGRMRIQKKMPDQQLTVSDGKSVWVYNPGPNQVWRGTAKSWLKSTLMPKGLVPLSGYIAELKKNFNLSVVDSTVDSVTLAASPKDARLGYNLQFVFSTETWLPTKTIFVSDSARVTTLLANVVINPADVPRQFQFPIPKGATVIPLN